MILEVLLKSEKRRFGHAAAITGIAMAVFACLLMASSPSAQASASPTTVLPNGQLRTTYVLGPLNITSGQNRIANRPFVGSDRPAVNGWITRIQPDLTYADGTIPSSSKVMFHHGVWVNMTRGENFFATGEEKTIQDLPDGYGYRYLSSDTWVLNYMIHNLVPETMTLYATYTIDFIPDSSPAAASIKQAKPIWMDVERGSGYPVFDTYRDSGGADGEFVYPQDRPNAYAPGVHKNEMTIPRAGVLLGTTGHVHTGGLSTDLYLSRSGASYGGPTCQAAPDRSAALAAFESALKKMNGRIAKVKKSMNRSKVRTLRKSMATKKFKAWKKKKQKALEKLRKAKGKKLAGQRDLEATVAGEKKVYDDCQATQPEVQGNRVHIFKSGAHYYEPAGPVSWDMAMLSTTDDWRVGVKAGDKLEIQTTYETKIASWYENMGINVIYWSDETDGRDPYVTKVDTPGVINHPHYAENDDHGGGTPLVGPDPATLANGVSSGGPFNIGGYTYSAGDFRLPGEAGRPPVVKQGQTFTFKLTAGDASQEIWHSLTSCKSPCNKSTGIAYPIADGDFQFDSGQLGNGGAPTVGRTTWTTPANLPVGTHTFFCRVHPLMRGAFRVVQPSGT